MRRFVVPVAVVGVATLLIALLVFGVTSQGENTSIEASITRGVLPPVPNANMALPVLGSSATERLSSLRGKVVVLNVFASWCEPCQEEAQVLEHAQRALEHQNAMVLGVTYLDTSSAAEQFVRHWHLSYPVVRDVDGNFVHGLGTDGVPETFVIDRQGRIAAVRRYQINSQWLGQTLPRLLVKPS
jgi:cytochrome c biogenesis protein CcmG, thiol:disulfide interchange protein DsbE